MSHKPAGGPRSKNVVEPRVRTGKGSTGIRPGWTNAPGSHYGDHVTDTKGPGTGYRGPQREEGKSFQPVKFGNEKALDVKGGGPGTGRTIYKTGTQCMTGEPNPGNPPPSGELFPGWYNKR